MKKILVPANPGVLSALGMLVADFKKELVHSFLQMYSPGIQPQLDSLLAALYADAEQILREEGFPDPQLLAFLDMRYKGQSYELTVPYGSDYVSTFHRLHQQIYSYSLKDDDCEIVNLRVLASGKTPDIKIEKKRKIPGDAKVFYRKKVYSNGAFQDFSIYRRDDVAPGFRVELPAIIAGDDSTLIIPRGFEVTVDEYSNIILDASRRLSG